MKNHNHPIKTGKGQIIEAEAITQCECGAWIPATPEPYYANWIEKITHFFGKHWYYQAGKCVLCGATPQKKLN